MNIRPMGISNSAYLLDDNYSNLLPYQYLRELSFNGVEAGATIVTFRLDPTAPKGVQRLMCSDNGHGMSGDELMEFINNLAATGGQKVQGKHNNKGTGAKISTSSWNPYGVRVMSWTSGPESGAEVTLVRKGNEVGLLQYQAEDVHGNEEYTFTVMPDEEYIPDWVKDSNHAQFTGSGTVVVLLGSADLEDTFKGPYPDSGSKKAKRNILALNTRFFTIPDTVEINAFDPSAPSNRTVYGAKYYYDKASESKGSFSADGVTFHWWLLDPNAASSWGMHDTAANLGCLYYDNLTGIGEIYDQHLDGYKRRWGLMRFGITENEVRNRTVIFVEPSKDDVWPDTYRKGLVSSQTEDGALPFEVWGDIFRKNMPDEIKAAMDAVESNDEDLTKKLKDLLKNLTDRLLNTSWHRNNLAKERGEIDAPGGSNGNRGGSKRSSKGKGGASGVRKVALASKSTPLGEQVKEFNPTADIPVPKWVRPSCEPGFEDFQLGVQYNQSVPQFVFMNEEYDLFQNEFAYWSNEYPHANRSDVKATVKDVYAKHICFKIAHHNRTKSAGVWQTNDWAASLTSESLTFALLGLVLLTSEIKRDLSGKHGKGESL